MLSINKILPKIQIGYVQKMFSSVVMYMPINHPNSPQLFSPTDGIMLSKYKTNHFNTLCTESHFKTSRLPQVRTKFSSHLQCPKGRVSAHLPALLHTHTHTHTHTYTHTRMRARAPLVILLHVPSWTAGFLVRLFLSQGSSSSHLSWKFNSYTASSRKLL